LGKRDNLQGASFGKNQITVEVITEGKKPYSNNYPLNKGIITIGRSHDTDIVLDDTFVSKMHCEIKFKGGAVILEDKGSRNGTFVNGQKATAVELASGDKIQIGKTTVVVTHPFSEASFGGQTREFDSGDTGEIDSNELGRDSSLDERTDEARIAPKTPPKGPAKAQKPRVVADETQKLVVDDDYVEPEDDDDEDEDDEPEGMTYFPIVSKILAPEKGRVSASSKGREKESIEILRTRGDIIAKIESLSRRQSYKITIDDKKFKFISFARAGECHLFLYPGFQGQIYSGGEKVSIEDLVAGDRKGRTKHILKYGDLAEVEVGNIKYFIRFVELPELPKESAFKQKYREMTKPVSYSFGVHFLVFILVGLFSLMKAGADTNDLLDSDRFVKLDLKDLEPKAPEPTPSPTVVSTPAPKPIAERPEPIKSPKKIKFRPKPVKVVGVKASRRIGGGGGGGGDVNVAAMGALASLGGLTTDTTSASNVVKAVSNLDAVKAPRGTQSNFSVSGLIGKSSSGDAKIVRISGPSTKVGGINKDGGALGRIGGLGIGRGGGIKGRGVGGIVVGDVPEFDVGIKGSLTRQQILEVVQKHVGEISYCYEKALFDEPSLEGKLLMFWEINAGGAVTDVRIKSGSMRSNQVNRCVMSNIRTWIFPKPKGGGVVQVTFPFVFNAASF
jgi:pSer/pThr/pTyr-binding forkhead associated (FHA) protein/outer membrane biosynthesis protein TonB